MATEQDLEIMVANFKEFLTDPLVLLSLALQEAFLRQDAFILARQGELFTSRLSEPTTADLDLIEIFDWGLF